MNDEHLEYVRGRITAISMSSMSMDVFSYESCQLLIRLPVLRFRTDRQSVRSGVGYRKPSTRIMKLKSEDSEVLG